jgi:hypothetical protein
MRMPSLVDDFGSIGVVRSAAGRIDFVNEHTGVSVHSLPLPSEFGSFIGQVTRFKNTLILRSTSAVTVGVHVFRCVVFGFFFVCLFVLFCFLFLILFFFFPPERRVFPPHKPTHPHLMHKT